MEWNYTLLSGKYCPRQFEYHPNREDFIFGTISGEMCSIDTKRKTICSIGHYGENNSDTILGICWLKDGSNKFITGSSHGRICFGDVDKYDKTMKVVDKLAHPCIVSEFPKFERLTSVHVSCDNRLLLASGYANSVALYDLETGAITREYRDIHTDHINISRFCNHSPHLFATSSFDSSVKTWDLRMPSSSCDNINMGAVPAELNAGNRPIYSVNCASGVVMINFSNDDAFLMASALDNEINQYLFVDGRKHLSYAVPKTGQSGNFTRAYYSSTGRHVVTGSCEESTVRVMCTYTGEVVTTAEIYPGKKDKSLYIQSLRGSPIDERSLCVLTNYRDMQTRELVLVTLKNPICDRSGLYEMSTVAENRASSVVSPTDSVPEPIVPDVFASFFLPEYRETLLRLRRYSRLLTKYVHHREADENSAVSLSLSPELDPLEMQIHKRDGTDLVFLVHKATSTDRDDKMVSDADCMEDNAVVYAVHAWLLCARCPVLMNPVQNRSRVNIDITLHDTICVIPSSNIIDITHIISEEHLYLLPILLDFLYVGKGAVDVVVLRYASLQNFPESSLSVLLTPSVHSVLIRTHGGDLHKILSAVALDDYHWRSNKQLSELCLQTVQCLLIIVANLQLPALTQHLEGILSRSIHLYSVMRIYELSCTFQLNALCDCCVSYITKHLDFLRFHHPQLNDNAQNTDTSHSTSSTGSLDLLHRVKELQKEFSCEVIGRENFRIRKHLLDQLQDEHGTRPRSRRPSIAQDAAPSAVTASGMVNNSSSRHGNLERDTFTDISPTRPPDDDLWRYSESPHLAGSRQFDVPSAVCLTKFVGHHMCRVLDGLVLHIGGMNRERVHGLSRILCYNTRSDHFEYVYCEGSDMPYCSNLIIAVTLQKTKARHVLILGGKVSKADVPVKHTFLDNSSVNINVCEDRAYEDRHTKAEMEVEPEKDEGENKTASNSNYHTTPDTSDKSLCFVLDCHTLTWTSPRVLLANEDDSLICGAGRVARSSAFWTGISNPQQRAILRKRLKTAMSKRAAQTVVPLYHEDVPYRCAECLFRDFLCDKCNGSVKISHSVTSPADTTWLLQFGGYCTETENICNDIHILVCVDINNGKPNPSSTSTTSGLNIADTPATQSFRWLAGEVSGEPPVARFSHSAVIFPCNSNGALGEEQQLSGSVGEHSRMLIYGGIGHPHDLGDLSSLRVSNSQTNGRPDLHWEVVQTHGPGPGQRHGHSMVYLPEHNMCVLFGGLFSDAQGNDTVKNDIWCLFLDGIHYNTPTGLHREFGITVHWEQILLSCIQGPPANPRSRHACTVTTEGVMLVFGGVNETLEGTEEDVTNDTTSILQKQKDSLMHRLQLTRKKIGSRIRHEALWLNSNECSTFSYFDREPAVHIAPCSLNGDVLTLLSPLLHDDNDAHFAEVFHAYSFRRTEHEKLQSCRDTVIPLPDVTLTVCAPSAAGSEEGGWDLTISNNSADSTYSVYGSLVASRSEWLHTILTSNMAEAQSRHVCLHDTDPLMFKLLLVFFYADIVAYSSVDELYGLLVLANQFHIESLSRRGEGVLMKHLTEDNVCYLLQIADFLSLDLLKSVCFAQLLSSKHIASLLSFENGRPVEISTCSGKVNTTSLTTSDSTTDHHPQVMMCHSSVSTTGDYLSDVDAVDRATLHENFNTLRPELQQEVRDYCNTACHVYRLNMSPSSTTERGVKSSSVDSSEMLVEGKQKKKDGN